jgi:hypothetical protein
MIRNGLYLVFAVSLMGGCSGDLVPLGNGPSAEGGTESGGQSHTGTPGEAGSMIEPAEGGIGVEPTDASIGVPPEDGGVSCFPDCLPDAEPEDGGSMIGEGPDSGLTLCGATECGPGESCIATQTSGGPCLMPGDGGTCPKGTTNEGGCCVATPPTFYVCQITPPSCGGELTCGCSKSLCPSDNACSCTGVKDNVLSCQCEAP